MNRLEWNKYYYFILAGVTTLRFPQWFCQGINFFRKVAIWMWLSHVLLVIIHLTIIWLVNSVINEDTCSDAVLNNDEVFGWNNLRKLQYWWLGIVPVFALVGMFRSKRTQDCF